jgi:hypothetical protein
MILQQFGRFMVVFIIVAFLQIIYLINASSNISQIWYQNVAWNVLYHVHQIVYIKTLNLGKL